MSINREMDKDMLHTYNGILLSHKKEWNNAICRNMDGSEDYHTKWSKTKERQISYNIAYKWNLKKGTNELIYKIERESQTKKTNLWLPKERQEKNKLGVWY